MRSSYWLAATAALALLVQTPLALAQTSGGTAAPAATTAAPAATTPAAATTTPSATDDTSSKPTKSKKSASQKLPKRMSQKEIDHSMDTGTVPARYRNSVPKEYQQYVPFEKQ